MNITSMEIHPDGSSAVCELSFRDPARLLPFNVKGIQGLDADEIVARYYGSPGSTAFYEMMLVKRTIVALIELNPDYALNQTPSSLRDDLYRMIASSRKGKIDIWFKDGDDVVASILASFQKFEAPLFNKTSEIQMTVKCDEPFLKAPDPVSLFVVGLDPSLTNIQDTVSTGPHGFKFELEVTGVRADLTIEDPGDPDWSFTVTPVGGFLVGDVLHYSSEYNEKYLYLVRGGNTIHLADAISPGSVWPVMFPGDNNFALSDGSTLDWVSISYYPTFWGV